MEPNRRVVLVVGAAGVIGGNLVDHLEADGGWEVIGLSRRGGTARERVRHLQVDLLDEADTHDKLSGLSEVTHVFYAAYQDRATWAELVEPNVAMLVNTVRAVQAASPRLEHVSLMQGYKVYGAHLGPFKTPARESDPPHLPPEFNVDQQQFLEDEQRGKSWTWSAIRPAVVVGFGLGNPMNLAAVLAVYATFCARLGVPFRFPGRPGAWTSLIEMTDAGLLAEATVWAATTPQCRNQAYNITNGDLFRWEEMWPVLARHLGVATAPPLPLSLVTAMADKEALWDQIVAEHRLEPTPFSAVSSWAFGDFVLGWDYDVFADGSKARRHGFHRHVDSAVMFAEVFDDFARRRVIPSPEGSPTPYESVSRN